MPFSPRGPTRPGSGELDGLGPLERRVMDAVWSRSRPLTVRDVCDVFAGATAYTTLMTTMDRLFKKGLLRRRREGRAFVYDAPRSRGQIVKERAAHLMRSLLKTTEPTPVLSSIVDAVTTEDAELLDELHRLVQQRRKETSRR
jgi:predicted transcriptional regulator